MSQLKISIIFLVILGVIAGLFYWYFTYSQGQIKILQENNAKLTMTIQTQDITIKAQEEFTQKQNKNILELQTGLETATSEKNELTQKLFRIDLDKHARKNPVATEKAINTATVKAFKEIETLTKLYSKE